MTFEPDRHDFTIRRGTTFYYTMQFYTDETKTQLFNLTGYTAEMPIKDKQGGTQLLLLNTSNGGITLGGTAGTIFLTIARAAVDALTWTRGVYQLTITAPGGSSPTDPLLWGLVHIKPT